MISDCGRSVPTPRIFTLNDAWEVYFRDRGWPERECCLLVLNLVSSTLPRIRQPGPRLRVATSAHTPADTLIYRALSRPRTQKETLTATFLLHVSKSSDAAKTKSVRTRGHCIKETNKRTKPQTTTGQSKYT
jgi:hypothetical protein